VRNSMPALMQSMRDTNCVTAGDDCDAALTAIEYSVARNGAILANMLSAMQASR
jgi:hypothetical protein